MRCIEDVRGDLMRARHRLAKFLLRRGHRYEAAARGRQAHALAAGVELRGGCSQASFVDYSAAVELLAGRRADADGGARAADPRLLARSR